MFLSEAWLSTWNDLNKVNKHAQNEKSTELGKIRQEILLCDNTDDLMSQDVTTAWAFSIDFRLVSYFVLLFIITGTILWHSCAYDVVRTVAAQVSSPQENSSNVAMGVGIFLSMLVLFLLGTLHL